MLDKHPEIDVVSIITPSGMHYEHASDVIDNYKKHVIIEKPMFMTLGQGKELKHKAKNSGVEVFPVFQYRFNKAVQKIREIFSLPIDDEFVLSDHPTLNHFSAYIVKMIGGESVTESVVSDAQPQKVEQAAVVQTSSDIVSGTRR